MPQPVLRSTLSSRILHAVREVLGEERPVLLHAPLLQGNEGRYLKECVDTGWVSSAGGFVTRFESEMAGFTGAAHAVAVVNGTAGLHVALVLAGVDDGDEVLMPSLTFVATANAAAYCRAVPHFVDVDEASLGIDPGKLEDHLERFAERRDDGCYNRATGRRISVIVPMHTFGHPVDMDGLTRVADRFGLPMVEDAAQSLGSYYKGRHTGTFGRLGVVSFNGNKIVTTGAGGMILTDDGALAARARHVTTTAKLPHPWEYSHDQVAYNYRMPNLNAAVGCAQLERLPDFVRAKRTLAERYERAFAGLEGARFFTEPGYARSNYWLNAILLEAADIEQRDDVLRALNAAEIQSRPIWRPLHQLPMYATCPRGDLSATESLAARVINLPSSAHLSAQDGPS